MPPEPADSYPLAPLQRGMLFHALASPGSAIYVEQSAHTLEGELDLAAFGAAWEAAGFRHPALRTSFDWQDADRPRQLVWPAVDPPLAVERDPSASLAEIAAAERERGFDLARAPLFRIRLVRLADRRWRLLWTYHHLILDGWSAGVVLHDVAAAYEGREAIPDAPPYREFVERAGALDLPAARRHWSGVLAGFTEPTPLGITRAGAGAASQRTCHPLPVEELARFAAAHGLSLDTLLTGAWAVVLGRYAGTDDVVFGVTGAGRSGEGLDRMAGLLINTLPARVRLAASQPVVEWLAALERERTAARAWELTPLDRVQAWSELPAGRRLFDSILVVEDFPHDLAGLPRLGELTVTEPATVQQTNYPLTLLAHPRRRLVEALFDPGVLEPAAVRRLLGHLTTTLAGFTTAGVLADVDPLPPAERAELAARGTPRRRFPAEQVPARFARWADRAPDRVAVTCGDQRVHYGELRDRVARLAHRLRGLGVGPGVLVGICLPRGVDLVVAVLAVACAGGAYVPVDRRYPAARVRTVLDDASVAVLLTDRELTYSTPVVHLDDPGLADLPGTLPPLVASERSSEASDAVGFAAGPGDPAYVIYTSGSTGTPKGVVVEHAQLARLFDATDAWFQCGPDDVWTLFHSIAFDFSVWELWGALAGGGRLVVVPDELARDPGRFRELLLAEGVTVLNQTPSSFRALLQADLEATGTRSPYRLRCVVLGGEQLEVASLRPWLERYGDQQPRLVNMYGITETTVHVTYRPIVSSDLDDGVPSPIGEPIPDLAVRLLDPHGRLVPVGVPGEIHVGGAGVARGYLRRPELTAERFVTDQDGARWYRTGDRARWLPDGGLEFLGRLDDQVKIRGHRVEPSEIEHVLNGHPAVRAAAVLAADGPDGHRQLVAYVVMEEQSMEALRGWLAERVPDYLVPAGIVRLDRLPLTPNGKLDRAALPAPHPARSDGDSPVAPRTDLERELAHVWAEVLGLDQVGVTDNFFTLGGDSILIVQVASRARRRGIAVTPAQVFAHQTVAELAQVAGRAGDAMVEAEQGEVTGEVPVAPAQAWFHGLALPHPDHWNLPVLLALRRPVPADRLAGALAALVAHHDALRLRVSIDDRGRPRHRIVPVAEHGPVPVDELSDMDAVPRLQAGLDLARGPLLRAALLPDRLLLVAHHLVVDTVSWRVLLADLATALDQLAAGEPVRLPAKTTDVGQWARRLAELAGDPEDREWGQRVPDLPDDDPAAPNLEGDTELVEVALDEPASQDLLAPANLAYRTRTEELLLAGLARAAAEWSGRPGLLVDVEGHGRDAIDDADVTRTVGWFTTFTPTWLDMSDTDGVDGLVKSTKEQLRARQRLELPRPPVSFNYLGRIDQPLNGFALAPEPVGAARHPANPRPYLIDVVAGIRDGRLWVYLGYSARHHSRAAMQRLAGAYLDALRSIVAHCRQPGAGGPTPSDFPLAQVDQRQLDRLVERHDRIEDLYPLTPLQRGLLFHTLANPASGVYFEQFSLRLDGPLDLAAFTRAWTALLARHAVLRAGIAWQGLAAPHLVVHDHAELPLAHHDWRDLDEPARERRLAELLAGDRTTGFDLTRAPLTRLLLVRLAGERWQLVWSHHHIILDGWSVALLIQEVFDSYEAIRAGRHRPAQPPPPFRDYLAYLSGLDHAAAWSHWRRVLSGVTGPTPLGADRTAKPTASLAALDRSDATSGSTGRQDADYGRVYRRLPATHSDAVREFARAHQLTLDTVLHGAWALALAHRSGHDDVIFGVTSAGRPPALSGVEDMVGLFINTLPARVRVRREQPVLAWLAGLLRDQVRTREYEHTPLDQVRGWTSVPPDRPLFDSGRGLENYPMDGSRFRTGSVTISDIRTFEQSNYALSFVVVPDEALSLQLWYDAARFAPETADHLLRAAETLVRGLAADPDRTVGEVLDLVPALARHPEPSLDTDRLARRLRELPLVREAVVWPAADGRRLTAYLVPDPGAGDGLADRHLAAWQSLYDQTYAAGGATADPTRHFVGWNSSYTGEPIPAEAMAEWRAGTIARIRALRPARVLEIGCGTGLLLTGLLDSCERYLGTDFSAVCLAQVRAHLATRDPATRGAVTLRQQAADDPTGLEPGGFDVVILNSVLQYFPGTSYLERVLEVALRAAAPGGAVFLGDLRHHGLLAAFHTSVELHRAADLLPAGELHRRVSRSLAREQELLLDPAYLTGLPARRPEVGAVTVLPRLGRHDSELTRYRYDAVLRLGPPPPPPEAEWYDWHRDVLSRSEIGWLLEHAGGDAVGITGIPNARVTADVTAAQLLAGGDGPATAGELRLAAGKAPSGMDPEELHQLGERQGWSVTVSWAVRHPDGSLNALFQRGTAAPAAHELAEAGEPDEPATGGPLTNPPLRSTLATELERQARAALADHPGDLSVLVLDELPRTASGELDVAALPPPPDPLPEVESAAGGTVPARTADELRLARIWEQALGTGALDVRTSFFDLGGDSLLAIRVIDEAARALGRDIPLATLLQRPTIEGMATALRAEPRPWTPLVEITGGDGPPFFCVHPAGGNVLCYADLARLLAPRPFCALQARGVEGGEPPYGELPAMAARYLADVRARQPAGPYLLGGWSMGGLVAYEMAQQLVADGATVELLVMVETPTPELVGELPDEAAALARLLDGVVPLSPVRLRAMPPADRLRYVLAEAERAQAVPPDQDRAQRLWDVYTTHLAAFRRYRPRPYAGRSLLLRAADTPIAAPDYGWGPLLTGQWEAVEVPGSHESAVWPPHVHRLAEVLRTRLTGRT